MLRNATDIFYEEKLFIYLQKRGIPQDQVLKFVFFIFFFSLCSFLFWGPSLSYAAL